MRIRRTMEGRMEFRLALVGGIRPDLSFSKFDPKGCSGAGLALFQDELAAVVRFDDALGETEAEPPTPLLRGESGPEDFLAVRHINTLARIDHVDVDGV